MMNHSTVFGVDYYRNIYYRYVSEDNYLTDENIFLQTREFIVLFCSQPLSKIHLLLLPKLSFLNVKNCRELSPQNLTKIRRLHSAAYIIVDHLVRFFVSSNSQLHEEKSCEQLLAKLSETNYKMDNLLSSQRIKIGYHARPTFEPLHLHILTDDFDSTWLKTRRQWNSFNTACFLESTSIEEWLGSGYTISELLPENMDELENHLMQPIRCSHCTSVLKDIRSLKTHLKTLHQNDSDPVL